MLEEYIVVDLETTGLNAANDRIIEIGARKIKKNREPELFQILIHPGIPISQRIVELVGITDEMVKNAPKIENVIGDFVEYTEDLPLIGHNLSFDYGFLKTAAVRNGLSFEKNGLDTLKLARKYLAGLESKKLDALCEYFQIVQTQYHRAGDDARVTELVYQCLCETFEGAAEAEEKDFLPHPLQFSVKKESPITPKQIAFLNNLLARYGICPEYEVEKLTKSRASKEIDGILFRCGRS